MDGEKRLGCYRCGGQLQRVESTDDLTESGTLTVHLACRSCGQRYEIQYSQIAIFAISLEGEAQSLLYLCRKCGQLYAAQQDEPHMCRGAGPNTPDAGRFPGEEGT